MQTLLKWNYAKSEYEFYTIPDEWDVALSRSDMDAGINCAGCGKDMVYGDSLTSQEIHTEIGFGYGVCDECYEQETKRRKERDNAYIQ